MRNLENWEDSGRYQSGWESFINNRPGSDPGIAGVWWLWSPVLALGDNTGGVTRSSSTDLGSGMELSHLDGNVLCSTVSPWGP